MGKVTKDEFILLIRQLSIVLCTLGIIHSILGNRLAEENFTEAICLKVSCYLFSKQFSLVWFKDYRLQYDPSPIRE